VYGVKIMTGEKEAVLGISAFGHDTSACLVAKDSGEVLYAVAEERLTNVKHDSRFPAGGIKQCIEAAKGYGLRVTDVAINFNDIEFIRGALADEIRLLLQDGQGASAFIRTVEDVYIINEYYFEGTLAKNAIDGAIEALGCSADVKATLKRRIAFYFNWGIKYRHIYHSVRDMFPDLKVHQYDHHLCHAASAFFNSGFDTATVLVIDGQGESETVTIYRGDGSGLKKVRRTIWPCSLGIFYLNATTRLGFHLGDEYKVMGMAAYGQPRYYDTLKQMMSVSDEGELRFHETPYFAKQEMGVSGHVYYDFTKKFTKLVARRTPSQTVAQQHFDFAASVQKLTEDIGVEIARRAIALTGETNVAVAGGVTLNGLMNEQIRLRSGCSEIFIYPAAGDDGTAVGAAQLVAFGQSSRFLRRRITTCYYGYSPTAGEIVAALDQKGLVYSKPASIGRTVAQAIANNKVVARYNARAEFGPRALGQRSILANPKDAAMKDVLNVRIKHREPFRPFAPVCLRERVGDYFQMNADAPFMLLICQATERAKKEIPAVVHNDGTARVQTVTPEQNADLCSIISEFEKISGTPVIINTSFNVNGETIVDSPLDAIESFGFMDIDYLAIGDYWVSKEENATKFGKLSHDEYLEIRRKRFRDNLLDPMSILDISYNNDYVFEPGLKNRLVRRLRSRIKRSPLLFQAARSLKRMLAN
jgi:carbamoyltransferase